jgi:Ca-activated chloride channel homolog
MTMFQQRFLLNGLAASVVIAMGAIYINQHPMRQLSPEIAVVSETGQFDVAGKLEAPILAEEKYSSGKDLKSDANGVVDVIEAEDIGKLPDINAAEPLQRIPGASINRQTENKSDALNEPAAPPPPDYIAPETPANSSVAARGTAIEGDKTLLKANKEAPISNVIATSPATQSPPESLVRSADKKVAAPAPASTKPSIEAVAGMASSIGGNKADLAKAKAAVADTIAPSPPQEYRDRFETFKENPVTAVTTAPVSTFSIDVDTAAYSFTRRQLNSGHLPAKDAVRLEEMVNYFPYNYPVPESKKTPFKPSITVLDSPFKAGNKLVHIGIKGYQIPAAEIPHSNLVFLLDVSGSMDAPDKLPLVQQSMGVLLESLKPDDTVGIVIYAGAAGTVLKPTPVKEKGKILAAINNLQAGGSTAGAEGIALAYQLAEANFNPKGVNRIILATDGDFNVGPTGDKDLKDYVERKREKGIYLSVLGFGEGNYQDAMMQTLAQNGNGVAAYIDTLSEAQKVLVQEATSSLFPIANDVKIQVEFNPASVAEYRLLGYETRALKREDFNNDKIDAGEIGSGHSVTAIYEITPVAGGKPLIDPSRYSAESKVKKETTSEYGFLRIRYKTPGEAKSQLIETPILIDSAQTPGLKNEAEFATAVAGFSHLLRGSAYSGDITFDKIIELAQKTKGQDEYGYRTEFIQLVRKAKVAKAL